MVAVVALNVAAISILYGRWAETDAGQKFDTQAKAIAEQLMAKVGLMKRQIHQLGTSESSTPAKAPDLNACRPLTHACRRALPQSQPQPLCAAACLIMMSTGLPARASCCQMACRRP